MKNNKLKPKTGFIGGKFLPLHSGHTIVISQASCQVEELYVILTSSEIRDREFCTRDGIKYMPADIRLTWLGRATSYLENVKIIHVEDNKSEADYDWKDGADRIKKLINKPINVIFSSEHSYTPIFKELYPDTEHIVIDSARRMVPISATQIRKDLSGNWYYLPPYVRSYFIQRVLITGTESCGKTTLVKKLTKHYSTNSVYEVGRVYCETYNNQLTPEMFNEIGMAHYLKQKQIVEQCNKVMFVDSDAVITQYYLNMYFNKKSTLLDEIIKIQHYDLVLYLEPDVEWVDDGIRFAGNEELRQANNKLLKQMYLDRNIPFTSISGSYEQRYDKALELIGDMFNSHSLSLKGDIIETRI